MKLPTWTVWAAGCWSASSPASSWSCCVLLTPCWPSSSWWSCGLWGTPCLQGGQGWRSDSLFSPGSWECEVRHFSSRAQSCWGALWRLEEEEEGCHQITHCSSLCFTSISVLPNSPNMLVLTVRERCVLFLRMSKALEKEMFSKFWPLISMIWNKDEVPNICRSFIQK